MKSAPSPARNATAGAMSLGCPTRPHGLSRLLDRARAGHARVVDQDVQSAKRVCRLGNDALAVIDIAEIALERDRLAAGRGDLRHGGVGANAAAAVMKRDASPLSRQLAGDSF